MKCWSTVVVFLLLGLLVECQAHLRKDQEDDQFLDFEARMKKFAEMRTQPDADMQGWSKEELSEALAKLLPEDPEMREPALAELFMTLMEEEHPRGQGYLSDKSQGRGEGPESHGRFRDYRKIPSAR